MTPTRAYPALIFYDKPRLGGRANYATHMIFEQIMWMAGKSPIRQFWQQEFGRPPQDFGCPYGRQTTTAMPTVVSCSNHVFPMPDDWPEHVHNTGYWFLDDERLAAAGRPTGISGRRRAAGLRRLRQHRRSQPSGADHPPGDRRAAASPASAGFWRQAGAA